MLSPTDSNIIFLIVPSLLSIIAFTYAHFMEKKKKPQPINVVDDNLAV